jgi:Mrp family chromosome partitioning ATPase
VDGIILVAKLYSTTISEIKKILRKALTTNTEILGAILNNSRSNIFDREYEEYHDYYYYKYKHKYYYHDYEEEENIGFIRRKIINPLKKAYYFILTKMLFIDNDNVEEETVQMKSEEQNSIPIKRGWIFFENISKPFKAVLKAIKKQIFFEDLDENEEHEDENHN